MDRVGTLAQTFGTNANYSGSLRDQIGSSSVSIRQLGTLYQSSREEMEYTARYSAYDRYPAPGDSQRSDPPGRGYRLKQLMTSRMAASSFSTVI